MRDTNLSLVTLNRKLAQTQGELFSPVCEITMWVDDTKPWNKLHCCKAILANGGVKQFVIDQQELLDIWPFYETITDFIFMKLLST